MFKKLKELNKWLQIELSMEPLFEAAMLSFFSPFPSGQLMRSARSGSVPIICRALEP